MPLQGTLMRQFSVPKLQPFYSMSCKKLRPDRFQTMQMVLPNNCARMRALFQSAEFLQVCGFIKYSLAHSYPVRLQINSSTLLCNLCLILGVGLVGEESRSWKLWPGVAQSYNMLQQSKHSSSFDSTTWLGQIDPFKLLNPVINVCTTWFSNIYICVLYLCAV